MRRRRPKLSVVIPSYNEERHIPEMYRRLRAVLDASGLDWNILFVNNGSTDDSQTLLEGIARRDRRVTVVVLSRNFGSQGAHAAGLSLADGDAVVCMDGDLQDPPEVIPSFVEKWREGYDVVYGVRTRRLGTPLKNLFYRLFYRLLRRYAYIDIPLDAGDFALMDRKVYTVLRAMPEKDRFIRGLRAYAGFRQIGVPYVRAARTGDKPKYGLTDNIRMAFQWFFSFSYAPLELISRFAFAVGFLALVAIAYYLYRYLVVRDSPPGWMTLTSLVLLLGSIQLFSLGIIGTYIGKIFEETKGRPNFIVERVLNAPGGRRPAKRDAS